MFLLYKTTNLLNGKVYIGVHECTDVCRHLIEGKCTYLGSGSTIGRAISKYGKQNFARETLSTFLTQDEVLAAERMIVNEEWVKSNKNYNSTLGGGLPPNQTGFKMPQSAKEKISASSKARAKSLSETAKLTMQKRMFNGGWTKEQVSKRVQTRKENAGYSSDMSACNTSEAIAKRIATKKANGNTQDISYLHSTEATFKKTRTRIINQIKKGKTFSQEVLLKYSITPEDTRGILLQS